MIPLEELKKLLKILRQNGVTRFQSADVMLEIDPIALQIKDKQVEGPAAPIESNVPELSAEEILLYSSNSPTPSK